MACIRASLQFAVPLGVHETRPRRAPSDRPNRGPQSGAFAGHRSSESGVPTLDPLVLARDPLVSERIPLDFCGKSSLFKAIPLLPLRVPLVRRNRRTLRRRFGAHFPRVRGLHAPRKPGEPANESGESSAISGESTKTRKKTERRRRESPLEPGELTSVRKTGFVGPDRPLAPRRQDLGVLILMVTQSGPSSAKPSAARDELPELQAFFGHERVGKARALLVAALEIAE